MADSEELLELLKAPFSLTEVLRFLARGEELVEAWVWSGAMEPWLSNFLSLVTYLDVRLLEDTGLVK